MGNIENSHKRKRDDEDDDNTARSALNGKRQVKVEEKNNEDTMQDTMAKYNKITERDISCGSTMCPS